MKETGEKLFKWIVSISGGLIIWVGLRLIASLDTNTDLLQRMEVEQGVIKTQINSIEKNVDKIDGRLYKLESK